MLYEIDAELELIAIDRVGHRREIYDSWPIVLMMEARSCFHCTGGWAGRKEGRGDRVLMSDESRSFWNLLGNGQQPDSNGFIKIDATKLTSSSSLFTQNLHPNSSSYHASPFSQYLHQDSTDFGIVGGLWHGSPVFWPQTAGRSPLETGAKLSQDWYPLSTRSGS